MGRKFTFIATAMLLAATTLFSGCLSAGPKFTAPEAPSSGQSIVYFYRTNNGYTNTTSPGIMHNGHEILPEMYSQGYWKYNIPTGVHLFEPKQFGIYKKGSLTLTNSEPGQVYYVEVMVSLGYIGFKLKDKATGLAEIAECHDISKSPRSGAGDPVEQKATESGSSKTELAAVTASTLHVTTQPENARIRIMNIRPKFHQGIKLKPGKYQIEVSAKGYFTELKWVGLEKDQALKLNINLLAK